MWRDLSHPWTYRVPPPPDRSGLVRMAWSVVAGVCAAGVLHEAGAPGGVCRVVAAGAAASMWLMLGEDR